MEELGEQLTRDHHRSSAPRRVLMGEADGFFFTLGGNIHGTVVVIEQRLADFLGFLGVDVGPMTIKITITRLPLRLREITCSEGISDGIKAI